MYYGQFLAILPPYFYTTDEIKILWRRLNVDKKPKIFPDNISSTVDIFPYDMKIDHQYLFLYGLVRNQIPFFLSEEVDDELLSSLAGLRLGQPAGNADTGSSSTPIKNEQDHSDAEAVLVLSSAGGTEASVIEAVTASALSGADPVVCSPKPSAATIAVAVPDAAASSVGSASLNRSSRPVASSTPSPSTSRAQALKREIDTNDVRNSAEDVTTRPGTRTLRQRTTARPLLQPSREAPSSSLASITRRTTTKRETAVNDALNTAEVVTTGTGTSNLRQRPTKRREVTDNSVLTGGKIRSGEVSASKLTPSEERSTVRHSKKPTSVLEASKKGDTLSRQPKRATPIISPSINTAPTSALTASSLGRSSQSSASSSSLATTSRSLALKRETDENDGSNASKAVTTGAVTRTLRQRPTRVGSVSQSLRESNDDMISSTSRKIAGRASTSTLKSEAAASKYLPTLPQPAKSISNVSTSALTASSLGRSSRSLASLSSLASTSRNATSVLKREIDGNDALNASKVLTTGTVTRNLRQRPTRMGSVSQSLRENNDDTISSSNRKDAGKASTSKLKSAVAASKHLPTLPQPAKSISNVPASPLVASSIGRSSRSLASSASTSRTSALKRETDENDASNASKTVTTGVVTRTLRQRPTRMGSVSQSLRESNDVTISSSSRTIAGKASNSKLKSEAAASKRQPTLPQPVKSLSAASASKKPAPRPRQLKVTAATLSAPTPASLIPVSVAPSLNHLSPSVASSTTLASTRSKSSRSPLAELASNTITSPLHTNTSTGKRKLEDEQPMVADGAHEDAQRGSKRRRLRHDENNPAKVCVAIELSPDEESGSAPVSYSGPKTRGRKIVKNERSSDFSVTAVTNMESISVGSASVECVERPVRRAAKRAADSISDFFESNSRRRKTEK
jgi:hypothetical protein